MKVVLIVAKCNVNQGIAYGDMLKGIVLIVAKCNVNAVPATIFG